MSHVRLLVLILLLGLSTRSEGAPRLEGEIHLVADADSKDGAVAQIQHAFGEKSVESPELYPDNHFGVPHILIYEEEGIGPYFTFLLYRDHDGDRETARAETDRQRNEIKGYSGSDEVMQATSGQVARYRWTFRIESDLKLTYQFCHLFQLKGVGGDEVDDPLLTLSAVLLKGKPVLELRHWEGEGIREIKVPLTGLESLRGTWLQCDLWVEYGEGGAFRFELLNEDGEQLALKQKDNLNFWRKGMDFVRPKWGIYRSIREGVEGLNEVDAISFKEFVVQEWSDRPVDWER